MKNIKLIPMITLVFLLNACVDDDNNTKSSLYQDGFFVINEGAFTSGNATIDFINDDGTRTSNVFQANNDGALIGSIAHDMELVGDNYVLPINNSSKIIGLDIESFTPTFEISSIAQPRYIEVENDISFFVSSYGDGFNGGVYKITDGLIVQSKEVSGTAFDQMLLTNNELFVCQSGGYIDDNKILVLNANDLSTIQSITVGYNPSIIKKDGEDNIWILCNGAYDWVNYEVIENTKIYKLNPNTDELTVAYDYGDYQFNASLDIHPNGEEVLYSNPAGQISKLSVETLASSSFYEGDFTTIYQIQADKEEDKIFVLDVVDYQSAGTVTELDNSGQLVQTHAAGIIPTEVLVVD